MIEDASVRGWSRSEVKYLQTPVRTWTMENSAVFRLTLHYIRADILLAIWVLTLFVQHFRLTKKLDYGRIWLLLLEYFISISRLLADWGFWILRFRSLIFETPKIKIKKNSSVLPNQVLQIKQTIFSTALLNLMAIIISSAICVGLKPTTGNVVSFPSIGLPCV